MSAETIARALGAVYRSGAWWRCRCPAHGSTGASLALCDGARGLIVKCWAGCIPADILVALRWRGLISTGADRRDEPLPASDPETERRRHEAEAAERARKIMLARDMWRSALPPADTIVERYLCDRLPGLAVIPETIRFLPPGSPYTRHREGTGWPVMLAAVQREGLAGIVAVHRTWLSLDGNGRKATFRDPRLSLGPIGGGAVRLAGLRSDAPLVIAEGIESALAAMQLSGWPAWAALSAGGIERLVLPPQARDIVIAADRDANGTGLRAARRTGERWAREGRGVRLVIPYRIGADPNDLLRETRRVAA